MNKEELWSIKNIYENVIYEAPLRVTPLWDGPNDKPSGRVSPAQPAAAPAKPDVFARSRETANRMGLQATARNLAGPNAAIAAGAKPTKITPAKPGTFSSANATTAQKMSGGMKVYDAQKKAGDMKGAAATGMAVNKLKYGDNFAKPKTPNPLMDKTFGYQTGNAPDQQKARADSIINSGKVAAIKPQPQVQAKSNLPGGGYSTAATSMMSQRAKNILGTQQKPVQKTTMTQSYEWPSAKTIRDIAGAYASIYEAKKKDQDQDGDNDFADVRIARMIASGMSKAEAIAAVRNKEYNEEYELDEATRMRKELGKEGEIETRKELAARSRAYKRSGSVDKTIAAAERGADRPYIKHKRGESDSDRSKREERQSRTLRGLASSRRGSVRDDPRAGMRGYAAKVEGSDKDLQTARQKAMAAGTLTPKEKKQLGEEYAIYEIVASYLLENNFAETIDDANVIIENMSETWVAQILESFE
jgi:hypothetical protein